MHRRKIVPKDVLIILFYGIYIFLTFQWLLVRPVYCNQGKYLRFDETVNNKFDRMLSSIEEKLDDLNDRQRFDKLSNSMSVSTVNDLQIINHRLQNIEDQIARAESFNRIRLDKIIESMQKEEFVIDQLIHKIEKNHQQINNRFLELETVLEKVNKAQEDLAKNIQKANMVQSDLSSSVEEVVDNMDDIKLLATESFQNLNISQQIFHQHLLNMIRNVSDHEQITDTVKKLGEQLANNTVNSGAAIIKCSQSQNDAATQAQYTNTKGQAPLDSIQKDFHGESLKLIAAIDNMYNDLKQQTQSVESLAKESLGISNKIYKRIESENQDTTDLYDNYAESTVRELSTIMRKNTNQLETKIKQSFEMVLVEQHGFMDNCHRLQIDEDQIENKIIAILEKLLEVLDNRTNGIVQQCEDVFKQIENRDGSCNLQVDDIYKFMRSLSTQLNRNIAHTTNKVIEMEKTSKQLHSGIIAIKDTCTNLTVEIQHMDHNLSTITQLIEKEYAAAGSSLEITELPDAENLYSKSSSNTEKLKKFSNSATKLENFTMPSVIHQSLKDFLSPSKLENSYRYSAAAAAADEPGFSTKIRHSGNLSKLTERIFEKNHPIPKTKGELSSNENQTDFSQNFKKKKPNDREENISQILLSYLKNRKTKLKNNYSHNHTILDHIPSKIKDFTVDYTDKNYVLKFSNELSSKNSPPQDSQTESEINFDKKFFEDEELINDKEDT